MKKKTLIITCTIAILAIVLLIGYKSMNGNAVAGNNDNLAKYLTEQGVKMYGTEWRSYCANQKKLFGTSFKYIDYIDCDKKSQECMLAGVTGYPTWKIDGQSYPGVQPLERLAQLTGYVEED